MQESDMLTAEGVHHIGASVANLEVSLAFWERLVGYPARFHGRLGAPYLGESVGYPGIQMAAALLDLPGGGVLELLEYEVDDRTPIDGESTASPGHVHLCLRVRDCDAAWAHAVACGARPVRPEGPVTIDSGPNTGAKAAYLRVPDGVSLEFFQPPGA